MTVYWVTRGQASTTEPTLFLRKEDADRDAHEQNNMRGITEFHVVPVEVY